MYGGSLRIVERRINELYAMLQGLVRAYLDEYDIIELETDNVAAYWEWSNSLLNGVPPEHEFVVSQLNTRKEDDNMVLVYRPVDEDSNALARYVARHGAEHFDRMVIFANPFGRVRELWCHDMGLGPVGEQFVPVNEADLQEGIENEDMVVVDDVVQDEENIQ